MTYRSLLLKILKEYTIIKSFIDEKTDHTHVTQLKTNKLEELILEYFDSIYNTNTLLFNDIKEATDNAILGMMDSHYSTPHQLLDLLKIKWVTNRLAKNTYRRLLGMRV